MIPFALWVAIKSLNYHTVNTLLQQKVKKMTTKEAIDHFESVRGLAEALKCWPNEVYRWGKYPPKGKQYEIQVKTNNKLKAEQ